MAVSVVSYVTHINDDLKLFDVRVFGRYQLPDGPLLAGLLLRQRLELERERGRERRERGGREEWEVNDTGLDGLYHYLLQLRFDWQIIPGPWLHVENGKEKELMWLGFMICTWNHGLECQHRPCGSSQDQRKTTRELQQTTAELQQTTAELQQTTTELQQTTA